jgi:hypothetical protein
MPACDRLPRRDVDGIAYVWTTLTGNVNAYAWRNADTGARVSRFGTVDGWRSTAVRPVR